MKYGINELSKMKYSGEGIVIGKTKSDIPFIIYFMIDKKKTSRERCLFLDERNGVIYSKVSDINKSYVSLQPLLYSAVMSVGYGRSKKIAVGNGVQTKLIYSKLLDPFNHNSYSSLVNALDNPFIEYDNKSGLIDITSYLFDKPHYTPRICGCVIGRNDNLYRSTDSSTLSIAYKMYKSNSVLKEYFIIRPGERNGYGKFITTYNNESGKRNPIGVIVNGDAPRDVAFELGDLLFNNSAGALVCQFLSDAPPFIINKK